MLPLENIKILDLSRLAAGNMVSHMFADFGADVVKVEKPGKGDDLRNWKINGVSHWWAVYSRKKWSISIDLNAPGGIKDYMSRYGSIFTEMAKTQTKIPDWSEDAGNRLELERRKVLSEDDLEKRAKKRNFLLKQLRRLKIESDEP